MTATINASTTAGVVITPDNSGNIQLQWNGQGAPAFSAYPNAQQTLSSSTLTKILFQTEEFDTNNNFASSRFTPTVAGYYQIQGKIQPEDAYSAGAIAVYKNGSNYKWGSYNINASGVIPPSMSCLVYCNGSTDYIEFYASVVTGQNLNSTSVFTWFQGCMVRGA